MDFSQIMFAPNAIAPGNPPQAPVPQAPGVNPGSASAPPGGTDAAAPQLPDLDSQDKGGFFEKIRTDPAFSQAMLMMGSRLMQGMKPGQDEYGMMGDAAMIGMTAHNMSQANARTNKIQDDKIAREAEMHGAQMESVGANTERTKQETQQKAELFPETKAKLEQEVKTLRAQGRVQEAQALVAEYKADPKRIAQMWNLDVAEKQSSVNMHNASAAANSANARFTEEKTTAAKDLNAQGDPNAVLHGTRSGAGAAKEKLAEVKTYLQAAYPDKTEQEIARMVVDMQTGKKGEHIETLKTLAESEDKNIRKWAVDQMATRAGYTGGAKPASGTAPAASPASGATDAWTKARNSVGVGQPYTGPDGKTYTRTN